MDYTRYLSDEGYVKILQALKDGLPRSVNEICLACGFDNRVVCTGKIAFLRRLDAVDQAGRGKFRITDRGLHMLERVPKVEVKPR